METSFPRQPGDKALLSFSGSAGSCLRFWYHMWGADIGELNVYYKTVKTEPDANVTYLVWDLAGEQGNQWKFAQVPFDEITEVMKGSFHFFQFKSLYLLFWSSVLARSPLGIK